MSDVLRVDAGELPADEIIGAMREGRRVLISVAIAGDVHEVALRYDGETYLCDTPTRLHRHVEESEMRDCIERMGYGADED